MTVDDLLGQSQRSVESGSGKISAQIFIPSNLFVLTVLERS